MDKLLNCYVARKKTNAMQTRKEKRLKLVRLFDIIAQLVKDTLVYDEPITSVKSIVGYDDFSDSVRKALSDYWNRRFSAFLEYCDNEHKAFCDAIENNSENIGQYLIEAVTILQFIDEKITYNDKSNEEIDAAPSVNDRIYASCLFEKNTLYWQIGHLNSDESLKETGIWINPKLDSGFAAEDKIANKTRPLGNSNSFFHMNAILKHMRFFLQSEYSVSIKNIVLQSFKTRNLTGLKVGFGPLCCLKNDRFQIEEVRLSEGNFEKKGFRINGINGEDELIQRFQKDLWHAAEEGVDILFFPEMLGTERMIDNHYGISRFWRNTTGRMKKVGLEPPGFLIFPSLWKNRSNIAFATLTDGMIPGGFRKTVSFYDHTYGVEDLKKQEQEELIIVHIPDKACLSAMICADFLANDRKNNADVLYSCLGVDLLLVISFSPGEKDFVNKIDKFHEYGTSVIWGDSCEAIREIESEGNTKKSCIIGAVSMPLTKGICSFGEMAYKKCGFNCSSDDSCLFVIDLPSIIPWDKPIICSAEDIVTTYHSVIREYNGVP